MKSWSAYASPVVAALGITASLVGVGFASIGVLPPITGFLLFALGALGGAVLGLVLGAIGLLRTRKGSERAGAGRAAMGVGISALMFLFLFLMRPPSVPPIHDITTSPDDPPQYVSALEAEGNQGRDLTYPHGPADSAAQQRSAYPDLAPIESPEPPEQAFQTALQHVEALGWEIQGQEAPSRIEATHTSRSFRFVDDIVLRLRPNEATGGTTIDVRSTSRVGQSDLGANAARILALAELYG